MITKEMDYKLFILKLGHTLSVYLRPHSSNGKQTKSVFLDSLGHFPGLTFSYSTCIEMFPPVTSWQKHMAP